MQQRLERVVGLRPPAQRLGERRGADRHDHELLEVDVVVRVRAAVEDVHHRHRAARARRCRRRSGRAAGRARRPRPSPPPGHAEDGVGAERALVVGAVEVDHERDRRRAGRAPRSRASRPAISPLTCVDGARVRPCRRSGRRRRAARPPRTRRSRRPTARWRGPTRRDSRKTSTSTVGLPRESRTSRASMCSMPDMGSFAPMVQVVLLVLLVLPRLAIPRSALPSCPTELEAMASWTGRLLPRVQLFRRRRPECGGGRRVRRGRRPPGRTLHDAAAGGHEQADAGPRRDRRRRPRRRRWRRRPRGPCRRPSPRRGARAARQGCRRTHFSRPFSAFFSSSHGTASPPNTWGDRADELVVDAVGDVGQRERATLRRR